jgi:hypothetical protein
MEALRVNMSLETTCSWSLAAFHTGLTHRAAGLVATRRVALSLQRLPMRRLP